MFATITKIVAGALIILALVPIGAFAQESTPIQDAERIRKALLQAQLAWSAHPDQAEQQLTEAEAVYQQSLGGALAAADPAVDARIREDFGTLHEAIRSGNALGFAAARAHIWTTLLRGGYAALEQRLAAGDGAAAERWLTLREFRQATRFIRPGADATRAIQGFREGTTSADDTLLAVRADLLDTYQARMVEALHDVAAADTQGFASRRAELAALSEGYFTILAAAYREQRGETALAEAQARFAAIREAALAGQPLSELIAAAETALSGFRAAPLSDAEQVRRAGQALRFLSLVPVEYGRGVSGNTVTLDLEIHEAITFRDGAAAAFADLQPLLQTRDAARTEQAAHLFASIDSQLTAASARTNVPSAGDVQANVDQLNALLTEIMPAEWQQHDTGADFDLIQTSLDQVENAVAAGEYDLAESARLDAYAFLESGPEAKLQAFAPQLIQPIEDLFWYGQGEHTGLASLIRDKAPKTEIAATRAALDAKLGEAAQALTGNSAPGAVAANAALIVFREGLEAVLILASLMGSMKIGAQRALRKPLWIGTVAAFLATVLTWLLAQGLLTTLARYGERLEAVVSLIAIAVLLLITNWFFHDVYWTGWMANFHRHKRQIIGGAAGQFLGLVVLGFTSIYREGFETVLFLQALVLESGTAIVLGGVGIGLAGTVLIGLLVFVVQAKLPHKKMLIFTGILIGVVLLQMVGNTAHVLQVVGWLPIHPIRWLTPVLPYWAGMWFGLYGTWEGIGLQFAAGAFTIGSYFLAEYGHKRAIRSSAKPQVALRS